MASSFNIPEIRVPNGRKTPDDTLARLTAKSKIYNNLSSMLVHWAFYRTLPD